MKQESPIFYKWWENVKIKGGILVASLLGVNQRTTMDIDTTIKGFTVTISEIQKLIEDIISISIDDDVVFYTMCFYWRLIKTRYLPLYWKRQRNEDLIPYSIMLMQCSVL